MLTLSNKTVLIQVAVSTFSVQNVYSREILVQGKVKNLVSYIAHMLHSIELTVSLFFST